MNFFASRESRSTFYKKIRKLLEHRLVATCIIASVSFFLFNWIVNEGVLYTWNYRLADNLYTTSNQTSSDIVIVAIDDRSLEKKSDGGLGRWQEWGRDNYATVIENLHKAGAKTIGLDVLFVDPSNRAGEDEKLASVMEKSDNVILASKYDFDKKVYWEPLPLFTNGDQSKVGPINIPVEMDNIVRRGYVYIPITGKYHETFDIKLMKNFLDEPTEVLSKLPIEKDLYTVTNNKLRLAFDLNRTITPIKIPLEDNFFMNINFFGSPFSFQSIPIADVYNNAFDVSKIKNKIVLIGEYGATGLHDVQYTPVSRGVEMPGVEIHASIIQTLLDHKFLRTQDIKKQVISIGIVNFFASFLFLMVPVWLSIIILVFGTFMFIVMAVISFNNGLLVNMFYSPLSYVFIYIFALIYKYFIESHRRKYLKIAFSHYVSPYLVDQIIQDPESLNLGGSRRAVSILFSDIKGFTSLSEKLQPEDVVALLNAYLEAMTDIVFEHKGTLDKYIGDAIMAFWNAPLDDPDHAYHACLTAIDMQEKMKVLRQKFLAERNVDLQMRVGVNTGDVIVGNVGSKIRFDYTVIGDNVNLASRLEGANKEYDTNIMLSDSTYQLVKGRFIFRDLDVIAVKGKMEPVRIYELVDHAGHVDVEGQVVLEKYADALLLYRSGHWDKAKKLFEAVLDLNSKDGPSKTYIERCIHFKEHPPAKDWDGVFIMKTK